MAPVVPLILPTLLSVGAGVAVSELTKEKIPDIEIDPAREVSLDPNILDPQRKKRDRKRAAQTVLTEDFAPPVLGAGGVLGLVA